MSIIGNYQALRGALLYARGDLEKGNEMFAKAYKSGVTQPRARLGCAVSLLRTGRFDEAQALVKPLLNHKDARIRNSARSSMGIGYWKKGEIEKSVQLLQEVFDAGKNGVIYGTLGCVLIEHDLDEALRFNLEAYEYDEDDNVVLDNLGQIYFRLGEDEKAREFFEHALRIKPTQPDSLYTLGRIEQRSGNLEAARELFEKALSNPISSLCSTNAGEVKHTLSEVEALLAND